MHLLSARIPTSTKVSVKQHLRNKNESAQRLKRNEKNETNYSCVIERIKADLLFPKTGKPNLSHFECLNNTYWQMLGYLDLSYLRVFDGTFDRQ